MTALRPYQLRAVEAVRSEWLAGHRSVLLVAPTGAGKTVLAQTLAATYSAPLVVAHRLELVEQTRARIPGARVETIQGLLASGTRPPTDILCCDEAHHMAAAEWRTLLDAYRETPLLGLTATPARSDGAPLGDLFSRLVVAAHYSELVAGGWLVPCRVFRPDEALPAGLAQPPVEAWQRIAAGRRTFAFVATIEQAEKLAAEFLAAGIAAAPVHSGCSDDERADRLERFRRGEVLVLCNPFVLTEGVDVPEASCCLLARGCSHASPYLQMVGRVLRPSPDKADAILIDLPGVSYLHGLPTEDRIYSLDGRAIQAAGSLHVCLECGYCYEAAPPCPRCGYEPPVRERPRPRIWSRELAEVWAGEATPADAQAREWLRLLALCRARGWGFGWAAKQMRALGFAPDWSVLSEADRRADFARLQAFGAQRGYKPGFAAMRFREQYGAWPPRSWQQSPLPCDCRGEYRCPLHRSRYQRPGGDP